MLLVGPLLTVGLCFESPVYPPVLLGASFYGFLDNLVDTRCIFNFIFAWIVFEGFAQDNLVSGAISFSMV